MHTEGEFNKCAGDKAYASEYNVMYCKGQSDIASLPNAIVNSVNLTKLQYCATLASVPYNYLVVDSFTDNSGYNNTVCPACTTSSYVASALNGYYTNGSSFVICPTILKCTNSYSSGCYSVYACARAGSPSSSCLCQCVTSGQVCLDGIKQIYFNICINLYQRSTGSSIIRTCNWEDSQNFGGGTVACLFCYCYVCVCAGCYSFYCNGTCKCDVTINSFPNIILEAYAEDPMSGQCGYACAYLVNTIIFSSAPTKINSIPITWSSPVKSIYYTDETVGAGTIIYNVIDNTTGNCIATNVPRNTLYLLDCCVCCHRYEIVQCADAVSCIKSYAIAAGV